MFRDRYVEVIATIEEAIQLLMCELIERDSGEQEFRAAFERFHASVVQQLDSYAGKVN